jgi:hypothetical protein
MFGNLPLGSIFDILLVVGVWYAISWVRDRLRYRG